MMVQAKPGELKISWGKAERFDKQSLLYSYGGEGASKSDGRIMSWAFEGEKDADGMTLAQVLEARGYDLSTLKFSIKQRLAPQKEGAKVGADDAAKT